MRRVACLALLALCAGACGGEGDEPAVDQQNEWSVVEPADNGMDDSALDRVDRRIRREFPKVRSVLIARNGRLVFERYYGGADPQARFEVYSVTKSVVSTLIGIALADEKLRGVDQRIAEIFPEYAKSPADPRLRRLTLDDLLTMRAGYSAEPIQSSTNWIRTLMTRPFEREPGQAFVYDSGSTHLLSGILTKVTGKKASALARERIFRPLGIDDGWAWPDDGQGVTVGGDGLALRARDLAKLGQLYLQEGEWDGEQIVPAAWVRESTRKHTDVGAPQQGYGYQWWVQDAPGANGYAALGFGGQAIAVFPSLELVAVLTTVPSGDTDVRTILYDLIIPAVESR